MVMNATFRIVVVMLAVLLIGACAVTSGSTFSSVVSAEPERTVDDADDADSDAEDSASETTDDEQADEETEPPALTIETKPRGAQVYLDGEFVGSTPLEVDEIEPGQYQLVLMLAGYVPYRDWIELQQDVAASYEIQLQAITGFLRVAVSPDTALVRVDGESVGDSVIELPVGTYSVSAYEFGYEQHRESVVIRKDQLSEVEITLREAPFELGELRSTPNRFNPRNPGVTSQTTLRFSVTAPGTGVAVLRSPERTIVRDWEFDFTGPNQSFVWDGRLENGMPLPDGVYSVTLTGVGSRDGIRDTSVAEISINSSIRVSLRTQWSSAPGLLFVPIPHLLPQGNGQFGSVVAGTLGTVDGRTVARFPMVAGVQFGVGEYLEVSLRGGAIVHSDPIANRFFAGASIARRLLAISGSGVQVSSAVIGGGLFRGRDAEGRYAGPDSRTDYPGAYVAVPTHAEIGSIGVVIAPEARISPAPVHYGAAPPPANSPVLLLYPRVGLTLMTGPVTAGISAAPRFQISTTGLSFLPPIAAGAELHWAPRGSPIVFSVVGALEADSLSDYYVSAGGGISILN